DGEYSPVHRSRARSRACERGASGAPQSGAADDRRLSDGGARQPSPDREQPLLRGATARSQAARRDFQARTAAEVPRLLRSQSSPEGPRELRGPVALSDDRRPALRLPERDAEARARLSAPHRVARSRGETTAP